ncbi:DNA-3-methyladenine glycosylase [Breoghania sp. L-A4]|uniref:DNA-3-methyladenine glycosylase family protein n=1 Tax=Breoghania sp. L-A4 TaxID=2304600 RepID=UPI000E35A075|nr:DNA-3-methyladenine glycosylase [Breoghania sp. L-A4]AXS38863.1 DNA-3-methyladenine glycosylase 2 family protein [Breoghania sp. L-A4]
MAVIANEADVRAGLDQLLALDPRLAPVAERAGPLPLRRRAADFRGLAHIITGQQVSVASASAIFSRLEALADPFEADVIHALSDAEIAGAGLSKPKIRALRAVAAALSDGLDLAALAETDAVSAHKTLCAIHGVGPWTADIFLLFCAGHPDIFPARDIALQNAVRDAFSLETRPDPKALDAIAEAWTPWRGIAARLFWAYYRVMKQGRDGLPV